MPKTISLWAGTEQSFSVFMDIEARIAEKVQAGVPFPSEQSLLHVQEDGTGIIQISGPIATSHSPWHAVFGGTSYEAISMALVDAAMNPDVKRVVLDVNSGGGAVNGVVDATDLISKIDTKLKPIVGYTGSNALSAAYWLISSARKIYASKIATTGSVGVITTHIEQSKAMLDAGITATVLRAGKYKALASNYEPLSKEAEAQIQENLDAAYKVFATHVSERRNMDYATFDAKAGQGRTFFGAQGYEAGLVDEITSFDGALQNVSKINIDKQRLRAENPLEIQGAVNMGTKTNLSEQEIAALAAGIDPASTNVAASAASTENVIVADAAEDVVEASSAVELIAGTIQTTLTAVDLLQTQLKESNASLLTANVELAQANKRIADLTAAVDPMSAIVAKSMANMQIALGASPVTVSASDTAALLSAHAQLCVAFDSKFKAGGVAATSSVQADATVAPVVDNLHKARIAATQNQPSKGAK